MLVRFELGTYVGLSAEARHETEFINAVMDALIAGSVYSFDNDLVSAQATRIAEDLRTNLKVARKPLSVFCYLQGISEDDLEAYCANEYMRGLVEDAAIIEIAQREGIVVDSDEVLAYRDRYQGEYTHELLRDGSRDDTAIKKAILTKKCIQFLMGANKWIRIGKELA